MLKFRVRRLDCRPGDTIVATCEQVISTVQAERIREHVRSGLTPGLADNCGILVLDRGTSITVLGDKTTRPPSPIALWLRGLFGWKVVKDTGVWVYLENSVTGARRVSRGSWVGYQPIDRYWLAGGPESEAPLHAPFGSGVKEAS
jgi:hypothetical protein